MTVENHTLTQRQRAVCDLLIEGLSNKEISERLGISHRTVEAHRIAVFRKCGVRNVVELVRVLLSTKGEEVHG